MIDLSKISSVEEKLLISLCRLQFDDKQREEIIAFTGQVTDWSYFTRLANEHGIIALVSNNIKECGVQKMIPEDQMKVIENGYMQSLVRNTWLTERWKEVNAILSEEGIKHILLKGMSLEHTIYGSKGLRQMNDNDILIKYEDAFRAWYILQQNGFSPEPIKSKLFRKFILGTGHHLPALNKNGFVVEIHHKLFNNSSESSTLFPDPFDSAIAMDAGGTKALMLSKDLNISYLISHFEKHASGGHCQLRLYTDIMMLDPDNKIDVPAHFISIPRQSDRQKYRMAAYRETLKSIPAKYRFRFIIGDIFPSVKWMKKRYCCSAVMAVMHYPPRIGKVLWLLYWK